MNDTYTLTDVLLARFQRPGYRLLIRLPYVADKMPVRDVQRVNKTIRTMFNKDIYTDWLLDLDAYIQIQTKSNPKRYYAINKIIRKEIEKNI